MCSSVAAWSAIAAVSPGCAWPSDVDADARHEVEILAAVDVVETRAAAAHERHRLTPVGLEHVPRFAAPGCRRVSSSSHHLCAAGQRRLCAAPACRAARPGRWQSPRRRRPCAAPRGTLRSLATMPLFAVPALISCAALARASAARSSGPARRARRTCRRRSPAAGRRAAAARCDASVSALTFSSWPSRVAPRQATTGT